MNVQLQMTVTATPCVPTLKDPTSVDVSEVLRAMEETAHVRLLCLGSCLLFLLFSLQTNFHFLQTNFHPFFNVAVSTGCSPSCGLNAFCEEGDGSPACVCSFGYQGDGFNCTGSSVRDSNVLVCCTFNCNIIS